MPVSPNKIENSTESWNDADWILFNIIRKTVKEDQKAVQETVRQCKRLFKQKNSPANPREVLTKLGELLRAGQDEQALAKHINLSKQGNSPKTPDELKESLKKQREDYECYIQHFLPALLGKITQSTKLDKEKAKEIGRIISEIISKSSNKYSKIEEQPINSIKEEIPVSSTGMTENNVESPMTQDQTQQELESLTKEEVCVSESDSGINSPGLASSSRRSSLALVTSTSSEENLNSTSSSAEEDNGLQPGDEGETKLAHPTKTRSEGPSGRRPPSKHHEKIEDQVENGISPGVIQVADTGIQREKNTDSSGQATQVKGGQTKDSMQPEEKKDKKNTTTTVQKSPANKNNSEDTPPKKQPNNRNLHVALVAGCALSTIGCIVAGAMTSGLVGAGLLAMAAVFAIAAVAELHSNFLSSKLTSINVSPLVDDKSLQHVRSGKN